MDIFRKFVKDMKDEAISILDDATNSSEFNNFIDTGSYSLNIAFSGSTRGGLPDNKTSALAGVSGVGKTYILLGIMRTFLQSDPRAGIIAYETEGATTKGMAMARGIDTKRVIVAEPLTLQDFQNKVLKALKWYEELPAEERPPLMFTLDSLGQLPTIKEIEDAMNGNHVRDMTRNTTIRSIFRVLDMKLSKLHVPMVITNHTYADIMSYGAPQKMSGGGGVEYAADFIMMLSKKKIKGDEKEVVGNEVTVKIRKSRFTRENEEVSTRIMYDGGMDRYYGLRDICCDAGIWKKVSTKVAVTFYTAEEAAEANKKIKDPKKHIQAGDAKDTYFASEIDDDPKKFFTDEILAKIDEYAKTRFVYGPNTEVAEQNIANTEAMLDAELAKVS